MLPTLPFASSYASPPPLSGDDATVSVDDGNTTPTPSLPDNQATVPVFPPPLVSRMEAHVVTSIEELEDLIREYEASDTDDPVILAELEDARGLLREMNAFLETGSDSPLEDPLAIAQEKLEMLLANSSYETKASVWLDMGKSKRGNKPDEYARLNSIHSAWNELETLTGEAYHRSPATHTPTTPSQDQPFASSSFETTSLFHSENGERTVEMHIQASELKSRRLNPVTELLANLETYRLVPHCAESLLNQLNLQTKLAFLGHCPSLEGESHEMASSSNSASFSQSSTNGSVPPPNTPIPILLRLYESFYEAASEEGILAILPRAQLQNLQSALTSGDYKIASEVLTKLVKAVNPANLLQVLRLCEATTQAIGAVQDKMDVVMLFGETNVGKTSIVRKLAGCEMFLSKVVTAKGGKLLHLHSKPPSDSSIARSLESFSTSPLPESETSHINAITLPHKGRRYVVVDTPGTNDTSNLIGPEVEIANNKGLGDAIRAAQDVRIIVVLEPSAFEARLASFMKQLETLAQMMPHAKDMASSILFLINKLPPSALDQIVSLVVSKRDEMGKAGTFVGGVADLIDIFIEQCEPHTSSQRQNRGRTVSLDTHPMLDLIHGSPTLVWDKIVKVEPLANPSATLHSFVTQASLDKLKVQLQRDVTSIHQALQRTGPKAAKLIRSKLNTLSRLYVQLNLPSIRTCYNDALCACNTHISKMKEVAQCQIMSTLSHDTISTTDIVQFLAAVSSLEALEVALGIHASDSGTATATGDDGHLSSYQHPSLISQLNTYAHSLLKDIRASSSVFDAKALQSMTNLQSLSQGVSAPSFSSTQFQTVFDAYKSALTCFIHALDALVKTAPTSTLAQLAIQLDSVGHLILPTEIEESRLKVYALLKENVCSKLEAITENANVWKTTPPFRAPKEKLVQASETISSLHALNGHLVFILRRHVHSEALEKVLHSVMSNVTHYFVNCCKWVVARIPRFDTIQPPQQLVPQQQIAMLSSTTLASSPTPSSVAVDSPPSLSASSWNESSTASSTSIDKGGSSMRALATQVQKVDDLMNDFPGLSDSSAANQAFQDMLSALFRCIDDASIQGELLTTAYFNPEVPISLARMRTLFGVLVESKWLDDYELKCNILTIGRLQILESMTDALMQQCRLSKELLFHDASKMRLQDYSRLPNAITLVYRISCLETIKDLIPEVTSEIDAVRSWFIRLTEDSCCDIRALVQKDSNMELRERLSRAKSIQQHYQDLATKFDPACILLASSPLGTLLNLQSLDDVIVSKQSELTELSQSLMDRREKIAQDQNVLNDSLQQFHSSSSNNLKNAKRNLRQKTGFDEPGAAQADFDQRVAPLRQSILEDENAISALEEVCKSMELLKDKVVKAMQRPTVPKEAHEYLRSITAKDFDVSSLPPTENASTVLFESYSALESYIKAIEGEIAQVGARKLKRCFEPISLSRTSKALGYLSCFDFDSNNGCLLPDALVSNVREVAGNLQHFLSSYIGFIVEQIDRDWRLVTDVATKVVNEGEEPPQHPQQARARVAESILRCIQELNAISSRKEFGTVRDGALSELETFERSMLSEHKKLCNQLLSEECTRTSRTTVLLEIAYCLSILEGEFERLTPSFYDLYLHHFKSQTETLRMANQTYCDHLRGLRFTEAALLLDNFSFATESVEFVRNLRRPLELALSNLLRSLNGFMKSWNFDNLVENAKTISDNLSLLQECGEATNLHSIVQAATLHQYMIDMRKALTSRILGFITCLKKETFQIETAQEKIELLKSTVSLLDPHLEDAEQHLQSLDGIVQQLAHQLITGAKQRPPNEWYRHSPKEEHLRLKGFDQGAQEYFRVILDNVLGLLDYAMNAQLLVRVLTELKEEHMSGNLVGRLFELSGFVSSSLDVYPSYLVIRASSPSISPNSTKPPPTRLYFVENAFCALSSARLLYGAPGTERDETFECILASLAHNERLDEAAQKSMHAKTGFSPSIPNATSLLEDVERCLPLLPDSIVSNVSSIISTRKQCLAQNREKLSKDMMDSASIGDKASYDAALSKLKSGYGSTEATSVKTQMCQQLASIHSRLTDALTACEESMLLGNASSAAPSLPLGDVSLASRYALLNEPVFRASLELIVRRVRKTWDGIFAIIRAPTADAPLPIAVEYLKEIYTEAQQSQSNALSFLGYEMKELDALLSGLASFLASIDSSFTNAISSLVNLEETKLDTLKKNIYQKIHYSKQFLAILKRFCSSARLDPTHHPLALEVSKWISPQVAIQKIYSSVADDMLRTCTTDIFGLETMSVKILATDKRKSAMHRILVRIQIQQQVAHMFLSLGSESATSSLHPFSPSSTPVLLSLPSEPTVSPDQLRDSCVNKLYEYIHSSTTKHVALLSSPSPPPEDCELLTQFLLNLQLLQDGALVQVSRNIFVPSSAAAASESSPISNATVATTLTLDRVVDQAVNVLRGVLSQKVDSYTESLDATPTHPDFEAQLRAVHDAVIGLMDTSSRFALLTDACVKKIDQILETFSKRQNSLVRLRALLGRSTAGALVMNSFPIFAGHMVFVFNELTKTLTIDDVLEKAYTNEFLINPSDLTSPINNDNRREFMVNMKNRWERFWKTYYEKVTANLTADPDFVKLVDAANEAAQACTHSKNWARRKTELSPDAPWPNQAYTTHLPDLVANVFAIWTLMKVKYFFESSSEESNSRSIHNSGWQSSGLARKGELSSYLQKPKPSQILAIFRLLGVGDLKEGAVKKGCRLNNHLVEVKTGEGKSVIVAVFAICLVLLGFDVDVACYSEYMTDRDFTSSRAFFDLIGVTPHISYGTFAALSEKLLNTSFDIRKRVGQVLSNQPIVSISQQASGPARRKVLLIDEVDVFFSKNFYGCLFTPETTISDPTITALVKTIWTMHKADEEGNLTLHALKKTTEYKACETRFPRLKVLLADAAQFMILALPDFATPHYRVSPDGRIGYVELDGKISYKINYGYKTMWAYFAEHEKTGSPVNDVKLEEAIAISIHCGHFSYSEIPRQYSNILGVTGTLRDMSSSESAIIKDYGIERLTYIPSMYGESKFDFRPGRDTSIIFKKSDDTDATHLSEFFLAIHNILKQQMEVDPLDSNRDAPGCCIVFFENEEILLAFVTSEYGKKAFPVIAILDSDMDTQMKEVLIRDASRSGRITVAVRSVGRGTDFACHDAAVLRRGGVLVIQTFLSLERSEETQIQGRSARQGQPGGARLVLRSAQLEQVGVRKEIVDEMARSGVKYDVLNQQRNEQFKFQYESNRHEVTFSQVEHARSMTFWSQLRDGKTSEVMTYLQEQNKAPEPPPSVQRVLILMDATGSMGGCVQATKNTVSETFRRLKVILTDNHIPENAFQIQYAVYRNYNVSQWEHLLESSGWHSDPTSLEKWLSQVSCFAGIMEEAMEVGLHLANRFAAEPLGLSQVLVLGDVPPNPPREIDSRRAQYKNGSGSWAGTPFSIPTDWITEIDHLKAHGIPVHAIPVYNCVPTIESFSAIAVATGGTSQFLDVTRADGHEILTELISTSVLRAVASSPDQAELLVKAYKTRDWKAHRA